MVGYFELHPTTPNPTGGIFAAKVLRDEITMAAHDLRNPLACVVSTLELLEARAQNGMKKEVGTVVRRGLRAAERMENMIQRLLDNAHQQVRAKSRESAVCSLRTAVEAAIENNLLGAQRKAITLEMLGSEIFTGAEEGLLVEAIDNLISNAVKYSHFGSKVFCRIGQDARSVFIRISDRGRGLSRIDLKRLGQPFQRLSAIPTAGEKSTGLGLWSTRRIAAALNGGVTAESAGFNMGATFTLRLPFHQDRVHRREMAMAGA